ncbi:AAA family ATPase [Symbiobacterium terraclitae]|uniref:AAA family ATPase n=1 Tax=Symbiobacterium terraclitae TaxID=557451 RepID=UPI0035B53BAB
MRKFPVKEVALGVSAALLAYLAVSGVNVLPVLFLGGLALLLYQTGSLRNPSAARVAAATAVTVPDVRFEDIGGQSAAKKELQEAIEFIRNREQIARMGIRPLKGILLTGPPGTGKTLLAKAAAHHTDSVFLAASGSEFVEMYAGVGAQRVRDLFRRARETARKERKGSAIIFIDEIEVLGARRGSHSSHMEYDQTLNQLLTEMDGIAVDEEVQVLVMGATNRVDMMDPALLRPGRFDRTVSVDLPDKEARLAILRLHTRQKPLGADVDLEAIARQTFGFSGAHLESLANEAAILALREGLDEVRQRHFVEAVDKVMLGEKIDRKPTQEEKRRVAVHEAGHALVGEWVEPGSVATVTITPRGQAMGYVRTGPTDDRYLYTRPMLEGRIRVALAGFLAEELVFGEASTGASNDFEQATRLARHIVHAGLSPLGIVDAQHSGGELESAVVRQIIADQREQVAWFLAERRPVLDQVADTLVDVEVIDGDRIRQILADAPPLPPVHGPALPESA